MESKQEKTKVQLKSKRWIHQELETLRETYGSANSRRGSGRMSGQANGECYCLRLGELRGLFRESLVQQVPRTEKRSAVERGDGDAAALDVGVRGMFVLIIGDRHIDAVRTLRYASTTTFHYCSSAPCERCAFSYVREITSQQRRLNIFRPSR